DFPECAYYYLLKAQLLNATADYQSVLKSASKAIELLGINHRRLAAQAFYLPAYAHAPNNQHSKALNDVVGSILLYPIALECPEGKYLLRGSIYGQTGMLSDALCDAYTALHLNTSSYEASQLLWHVYYKMGRFYSCLDQAEQLVQDHGVHPEPHIFRAISLNRLNRHAEALRVITEVLDSTCRTVLVMREKGIALEGIGEAEAALKTYDALIELNESDKSAVLLSKAGLLVNVSNEKLRNGPLALRLANSACELQNWTDRFGIMICAQANAECGEFDRALALARKCDDSKDTNKPF